MMDQRPLRLGDRIDDYCPRERRLTNHVVTVMQGDEITHTRCTACDADHAFKQCVTLLRQAGEEAPEGVEDARSLVEDAISSLES